MYIVYLLSMWVVNIFYFFHLKNCTSNISSFYVMNLSSIYHMVSTLFFTPFSFEFCNLPRGSKIFFCIQIANFSSSTYCSVLYHFSLIGLLAFLLLLYSTYYFTSSKKVGEGRVRRSFEREK